MPRNSEWLEKLRQTDLVTALRIGLGTLVALNLAATWLVFNPPGGSVSSLSEDTARTQQQIAAKQAAVRKLHAVADKVKTARQATERFEQQYFLTKRTYTSTVVDELGRSARAAGIREREKSYNVEAVEGADNLQLLTVSANYEGNYADLVQFVSMVDRSDRLLILESLQAQPQSAGQGLGIQVKLNAIVRDDGSVAPISSLEELQKAIPVKVETAPAAPKQAPVAAAPAPAPKPVTMQAPPLQRVQQSLQQQGGYTSRSGDAATAPQRRPPVLRPQRRGQGGEEEK